jgi:predicted metal-dependent HD superfamily phosphohydrolase
MEIFELLDTVITPSVKTSILVKYAEDHRFYHTFEHIAALYNSFKIHKNLIKSKQAFLLAILFHDVVYDPERNDNELKSVDFFIESGLDLGRECIDLVVDMIKSTINHQSTVKVDAGDKADLELFLDCDLSILGSDLDTYEKYAANIRKEYLCFNDEDYRKGRTAVLQKLLSKDALFYNKDKIEYFKECDRMARVNIARELENLTEMSR